MNDHAAMIRELLLDSDMASLSPRAFAKRNAALAALDSLTEQCGYQRGRADGLEAQLEQAENALRKVGTRLAEFSDGDTPAVVTVGLIARDVGILPTSASGAAPQEAVSPHRNVPPVRTANPLGEVETVPPWAAPQEGQQT